MRTPPPSPTPLNASNEFLRERLDFLVRLASVERSGMTLPPAILLERTLTMAWFRASVGDPGVRLGGGRMATSDDVASAIRQLKEDLASLAGVN